MSTRLFTLALVIALMGGVFTLDFATGREVDLWLLYLVPIGVGSFLLGALYGYGLTLLAALLLLLTTGLYGPATPTLGTFFAEHGTEASVYVVCVYLIGLVRLAVVGTPGQPRVDGRTRAD